VHLDIPHGDLERELATLGLRVKNITGVSVRNLIWGLYPLRRWLRHVDAQVAKLSDCASLLSSNVADGNCFFRALSDQLEVSRGGVQGGGCLWRALP